LESSLEAQWWRLVKLLAGFDCMTEHVRPWAIAVVVVVLAGVLINKWLGAVGLILAIVLAVVIVLRLLPEDVTGWKRPPR
jgi:hypothetical protein